MLPTEVQEILRTVEDVKQALPALGLALLAIPGVAVALHVLGVWRMGK